ncbi:hypothetical protein KL942_001964 [Ogataea angusta]|uniref:Dipeptidyl aminopeptidase A n=1 Tax=Pichia angusta TaxID=870730 RepID=A0ABQ7RXR8_PICAN|nr:hypothetical protein KL942_001964 [Ogataea angusta]KAG7849873.1 hypothetical protein KL940_002241 [Ogataea angusta]
MARNSDTDRLDADIELQNQTSRRNSFQLEELNNFAIDDDDADLVYHPDSHKRLNNLSGDLAGRSFYHKLHQFLSLPKTRRKISILGIVLFIVWIVLLVTFAHSGAFQNGNKTVYPGQNSTSPNSTDESALKDPQERVPMTLQDSRTGAFSIFSYDLVFIDIPGLSYEEDQGYYLHRSGSYHFLKKASDSEFNKKLYDQPQVEYNGQTHRFSLISLNSKLNKALLVSEVEAQWRYSSYGVYWILDVDSGAIKPVFEKDSDLPRVSFAEFSPQGRYVTFVFENNIYLLDLQTNEQTQITNDGNLSISNGKPDWVYEEEVLSSDRAIYWCQDESHFSFIRFDDTDVPVYDLEYFRDNTYPVTEKLKYPKPGYNNPVVSVHVYSLSGKTTQEVTHDDSRLGSDYVVYQMAWTDGEQLIIKETDRTSRLVDIRVYDSETKKSTVVRSFDTKDYEGWYNNNGDIYTVPGGGYIDTVVYDYHDHLAYFEHATDSEPKIITKGDWDVVDGVAGYNPTSKLLYLIGTAGNALERHIFTVKLDGTDLKNLTNTENVSTYQLSVSSGGKYGLVKYKGPAIPTDKIIQMENFTEDKEEYVQSKNLNTANMVEETLKRYQVPSKEYKTVTLEDGTKIDVIEVRPFDFNPRNKYPLLVSVYGGPGAQKLSSAFNYGFEEVLVSSLEIIVWYIDPRGTGGRGWKYKAFAKDKIGYWEPRDIVETTQRLIETTDYIDMDLTAIWGWSYGGFTTLKTLEYDSGTTFKYGMAVAPVTNWLLYDSIYTERYMGRPEDNGNYQSMSKISDVDKFKQVTRFIIMHGTADDNVHYQNTLQLLDAFNKKGVENYDMHVFPDSNHNINHNNANMVVYDKLYKWLEAAFDKKWVSL